MNRQYRLQYCKICIHKKNHLQKGIVCALTDDLATFKSTCSDFKENEQLAKEEVFKERKRTFNHTPEKKRNPVWGVIITILLVIKLLISLGRCNDNRRKKANNNNNYKNQTRLLDKHFKRQQPKTINYLTSSDRLASRFNYLQKDTSFYLAKSIKINMHEKYKLSIIKGNLSPVLAKTRGYAFTVDKLKKNSATLSRQWIDLRNAYSNGFNYTFIKKYSYKKMNIEEYQFSFNGYQNVYGVSRLIEVGNDRYFIHFANKRKSPNYDMLERYLNYYLKIE